MACACSWARLRAATGCSSHHGPRTSASRRARSCSSELIWSALDCPTIWAAWFSDDGKVARPAKGTITVLPRQRVELQPVPTGQAAIVTAWPIGHDGRKHTTGAAIHAPSGQLLARAESLLIDVER